MAFSATKQHVFNRGIAPDGFLEELIAWGKTAPDEIFAPNAFSDIYSSVKNTLGPWEGIEHRRAVMLEVMRVLAGFESSWNWNAGVDTSNPESDTQVEIEAGAWQVSANSMNFGQELKNLVMSHAGSLDPIVFQKQMKSDHLLAMEYIARLLRRTIRHHGPVRDHHIHGWLRRDAVSEFQELLQRDERGGAPAIAPAIVAASVAQKVRKIYTRWDGEIKGDISDRTGTFKDTVRTEPLWFPEKAPNEATLLYTEEFKNEVEVIGGLWKTDVHLPPLPAGRVGINFKFKGKIEYWVLSDADNPADK